MHYVYAMEGYPGDVQNYSEPNCFESILEREETYVSDVLEIEFINVMESIEYTNTCEYSNSNLNSTRFVESIIDIGDSSTLMPVNELKFKFKFNSI